MEEDIDIEEHDVLDHPQIRNIFPDLSLVKTELPDSEDEFQPEEIDYLNAVIKQESTDEFEPYSHDYTDDTTNYYPNKIILGTKPVQENIEQCKTPDVLKEYLPAYVVLEDYSAKLKNNSCYCDICERLFPTSNVLDAHKMMAHSFLIAYSPNKARKSTAKIKTEEFFCDHCSLTFKEQNDLIKHLYNLVPSKKFKCTICEDRFPTRDLLLKHTSEHMVLQKNVKNLSESLKTALKKVPAIKNNDSNELKKHLETKNQIIIKTEPKFEIKKQVIEPKKAKIKEPLIPKSVFQCRNCRLCFISLQMASIHKTCKTLDSIWKCNTCHKKFLSKEKPAHLRQHRSKTNITTFMLVKDLLDKVLCHCPRCDIHIGARYFKVHFKQCGKLKTVKCKKCRIKILKNRANEHMKKHNLFKLICIDYVKKRPEAIKLKKVQTNKCIYYCKYCKRCVYKVHPLHYNKECLQLKEPPTICNLCGLLFSYKSRETHKKHHELTNFRLKDVPIVLIQTGELIKPPMPDYYKCLKCKINFSSKYTARYHVCGEDDVTCDVCKEKFNKKLFPAHKLFHTYTDNDEVLPELIKKYESVKSIWNIIFKCSNCHVATDCYDRIVEHSQSYIKSPKTVMKSIKCYICKLKIDETYWSKHSDLHKKMKISAEKFEILVYNPENLLNESWYEMFACLPEEQIGQIVDKSVYSHERSVKMKLIKDGRSEFTIYTCNICNTAVSQDNIKKHLTIQCETGKCICPTCQIPFYKNLNYVHHTRLHNNGVDKSEFRIISFLKVAEINKKAKYTAFKCNLCSTTILQEVNIKRHACYPDRKTTAKCQICKLVFPPQCMSRHDIVHVLNPDYVDGNIKIKYFNPNGKNPIITDEKPELINKNENITKNPIIKTEIPEKININIKREKKKYRKKGDPKVYMVYKCKKCSVSLFKRESARKHKCSSKMIYKYCNICKQKFIYRTTRLHNSKHQRDPDFIYKNLKIVLFTPLKDDIDVFETEDLESREELEKVSKETVKKCVIYKCKCGLHYLTTNSIEKHRKVCGKFNISTENCSKCNHLFPTDVLVSHLCKHHTKNTEIIVEEYLEMDSEDDISVISDENALNDSVSSKNAQNVSVSAENAEEKPSTSGEYAQHLNLDLDNEPRRLRNKRVSNERQTKQKTPKPNEIKLYKCAECNVYYLNQNTCYKHCLRHERLDPRQYIECKLCAFQFTIMSLAVHLRKHHEKEFCLESVLVEEYHPVKKKGPPVIHIYKAIDRVQSLLVSSSNDIDSK